MNTESKGAAAQPPSSVVKVEVYSGEFCGYCTRARMLLEKKGVSFIEYNVDREPEKRAEMVKRSQRSSVPQIFINDQHIGGFDDLSELDMDDELDPLLGITS